MNDQNSRGFARTRSRNPNRTRPKIKTSAMLNPRNGGISIEHARALVTGSVAIMRRVKDRKFGPVPSSIALAEKSDGPPVSLTIIRRGLSLRHLITLTTRYE